MYTFFLGGWQAHNNKNVYSMCAVISYCFICFEFGVSHSRAYFKRFEVKVASLQVVEFDHHVEFCKSKFFLSTLSLWMGTFAKDRFQA